MDNIAPLEWHQDVTEKIVYGGIPSPSAGTLQTERKIAMN
jgi:hypothetical protein